MYVDICKAYPSVLLDNTSPIPIYGIHDVIEPFNCKSDLSLTGEFYINETIIPNYRTPIKLESGFYSGDLVSYLVDTLNMPLSQIKNKIVTKRALEPNTFRSYIEFIFNEFPEDQAKRLANSFIGELGRKYDKTNRGFVCRDYERAMCCWTRGMYEQRNVTVDHYNDLYLIKEQSCERIFSDNTSVNRFIVSQGILKLLQRIEICHGKQSKIFGINTDCIYKEDR